MQGEKSDRSNQQPSEASEDHAREDCEEGDDRRITQTHFAQQIDDDEAPVATSGENETLSQVQHADA
jgi:hypothetical protein